MAPEGTPVPAGSVLLAASLGGLYFVFSPIGVRRGVFVLVWIVNPDTIALLRAY